MPGIRAPRRLVGGITGCICTWPEQLPQTLGCSAGFRTQLQPPQVLSELSAAPAQFIHSSGRRELKDSQSRCKYPIALRSADRSNRAGLAGGISRSCWLRRWGLSCVNTAGVAFMAHHKLGWWLELFSSVVPCYCFPFGLKQWGRAYRDWEARGWECLYHSPYTCSLPCPPSGVKHAALDLRFGATSLPPSQGYKIIRTSGRISDSVWVPSTYMHGRAICALNYKIYTPHIFYGYIWCFASQSWLPEALWSFLMAYKILVSFKIYSNFILSRIFPFYF